MFLAAARRALWSQGRNFCAVRFIRCVSTLRIDPSVREFTLKLAQRHPAFSVAPTKISVLYGPPEFYTLLLDMIRRAQKRIFISSLYIGSARSELITTLHDVLQAQPSLHVYFNLDLNRSTRPGSSSTASILLPLIRAFPSRVHVSLFRSPHLRGILAKLVPPRFNEGWGTWHAKIYGADDDVMISGANLNQSYFTNRQDRYLHFSAQPKLAQYCFDFLRIISTFSYTLLPSPPSTSTPYTYQQDHYTLHWSDPQTHPHKIHHKAQTALSAFQLSQCTQGQKAVPIEVQVASSQYPVESDKVLIFPIIQAGQFNIREEEEALALLFRLLDSKMSKIANRTPPLLDLTSGYFGLYHPYQEHILASDVETRIVVAGPKANGFYGSSGISGRIPEGYTLLEQRFMRAVVKAGRIWNFSANGGGGRGVQLNEWEKDGWTYHAKGIWVSPNAASPPVLTLFGSTNLNSRSAHIDTELSFIMVVPVPSDQYTGTGELHPPTRTGPGDIPAAMMSLRYRLADEIANLRFHAVEWKGGERKVRFWTKVIVWIVKAML